MCKNDIVLYFEEQVPGLALTLAFNLDRKYDVKENNQLQKRKTYQIELR